MFSLVDDDKEKIFKRVDYNERKIILLLVESY